MCVRKTAKNEIKKTNTQSGVTAWNGRRESIRQYKPKSVTNPSSLNQSNLSVNLSKIA